MRGASLSFLCMPLAMAVGSAGCGKSARPVRRGAGTSPRLLYRSIFPGLEQADLDPKVFFRVLADVSDEPLELIRGLVQVVVERAVVEELAGGAVSPIESRRPPG